MNGLDVTEDPVLGDYTVRVQDGEEGQEYLLTARAGGELLWAVGAWSNLFPWKTTHLRARQRSRSTREAAARLKPTVRDPPTKDSNIILFVVRVY